MSIFIYFSKNPYYTNSTEGSTVAEDCWGTIEMEHAGRRMVYAVIIQVTGSLFLIAVSKCFLDHLDSIGVLGFTRVLYVSELVGVSEVQFISFLVGCPEW